MNALPRGVLGSIIKACSSLEVSVTVRRRRPSEATSSERVTSPRRELPLGVPPFHLGPSEVAAYCKVSCSEVKSKEMQDE